jgi:DNA polymerase-3 subunit epsilon
MVGISERRIADTPIAVIDFETTGLTPGYDRVVEVSVVRVDPGEQPRVVFDTLVNPDRPVAATEIHGITDADVAKAPRFRDIAGEVLAAVSDSVVAAYNVYFDIKFLNFELTNAGVCHDPPHLCVMYLRPMLGLGSRCKLDAACQAHGIEYAATHIAADDALAAGQLLEVCRREMNRQDIGTFADLAARKNYKFVNSFFDCMPFPEPTAFGLSRFDAVTSRKGFTSVVDPVRKALSSYWDALRMVLSDLDVSEDEIAFMREERERGGLQEEQIRVLHARAFSSVVSQFVSDKWLDDREALLLKRLHYCLARLGWAPGE